MQTVEKVNLTNLRKCGQVWDEMTVTESGRICQKCQHTIIDFRNLSDKEIAEIHTFKTGKVCGLYNKEQLQLRTNKFQKRSGIRAFYLGFIGMMYAIPSNAQKEQDSIKTIQTEPNYVRATKDYPKSSVQFQTGKDSIVISGTLKDDSGEEIIFGSVHIKGTKIGTTSNVHGKYFLNVTEQLDSLKQITLVYSYVGYRSEEIIIDTAFVKKPENRTINVLFKAESTLTDFCIRLKRPWYVRVWSRIKRVFSPKK